MELIVLSQQSCRPCSFVKSFLDNQDVNYKVVDVQVEKDYIEKYDIFSTPVTILLDDEGNEVERVAGYNPPQLESLISKL